MIYLFNKHFISIGADFIKTSTGKEGVNAIFPVALVMVRAIREYYQKTGYKVNFIHLFPSSEGDMKAVYPSKFIFLMGNNNDYQTHIFKDE